MHYKRIIYNIKYIFCFQKSKYKNALLRIILRAVRELFHKSLFKTFFCKIDFNYYDSMCYKIKQDVVVVKSHRKLFYKLNSFGTNYNIK